MGSCSTREVTDVCKEENTFSNELLGCNLHVVLPFSARSLVPLNVSWSAENRPAGSAEPSPQLQSPFLSKGSDWC